MLTDHDFKPMSPEEIRLLQMRLAKDGLRAVGDMEGGRLMLTPIPLPQTPDAEQQWLEQARAEESKLREKGLL